MDPSTSPHPDKVKYSLRVSEDDEFRQAKRASLGQVLFKAARLLNEQGVAEVREQLGLDALRPAHMGLFPHIDLAGTRLTEIARRVGVTKQAVGQLVDELEAMGMLERVPDPADGRAKLVRFAGGSQQLMRGLAVLGGIEAQLREELGARRFARLHRDLLELLALLERRADC